MCHDTAPSLQLQQQFAAHCLLLFHRNLPGLLVQNGVRLWGSDLCEVCVDRATPKPPRGSGSGEAPYRDPSRHQRQRRSSSGLYVLSFSSWRLRRPLGAMDPCGPPSLILCVWTVHTHAPMFLLHCPCRGVGMGVQGGVVAHSSAGPR